jgi:glucose/mannose transport system substrate-binding protein
MISKTTMMATAAILSVMATAAVAEPRVTVISQWAAGNEGAAMAAFGEIVTKNGAKWEHNAVTGPFTETLNKLRADLIAGKPPAASQLKGPEIAAWSKIGPTVNLDSVVAEAGFEKLVSPELAKIHKPAGHWIALPLQVFRMNNLYVSKVAMDKIGATSMPKTWAEYNAMAEKFKAAGITPIAHGGLNWIDTVLFDVVFATMNEPVYKKAIMELDDKALRGPETLAALKQVRLMTTWMNPANAGQHWSVFMPGLMKGEYGFLIMGSWASGVMKRGNFEEGKDYLCGTAPNNNAKPVFSVNSDALIFWDTKDPDLAAGQKITAQVAMGTEFGKKFTQMNGSLPARTDISLDDAGFQPCQRDAAKNLADAVAADQVAMSLGMNMAQPSQVTAALRDVLTEFVHNDSITPEVAQKRLADAADSVR